MSLGGARTAILGYAAVLLSAVLISFTPIEAHLDGHLIDAQFATLRALDARPIPPAEDVVVVGIDDETYQSFDRPSGLWHQYLGEFLLAAADAKPRFVLLDVILERWYRDLVPNHYRALHLALLRYRREKIPLVLATTLHTGTGQSDVAGAGGTVEKFPYGAMRAILRDDLYFGLPLVQLDNDGVLRRLFQRYPGCPSCSPTLLARTLEQLGHTGSADGYIAYQLGEPFDYVPLQSVIAWQRDGDTEAIEAALGGRGILLGDVTPFTDRHRAPIPLAAWEPDKRIVPGVLLHAQGLRSVFSDGLLAPAPGAVYWLLLVLGAGAWFLARRVILGVCAVALGIGLVFAVSTWMMTLGVVVHGAVFAVAAVIGFTASTALESLRTFRERRRLRSSFGAYVSPNVLKELLAGNISPEMGGVRRHVCVLFSDVRGFTSRSESQPPEAIIDLLNRYFDRMTQAVHDHDGTVDKYIGDGLMAFFGAPNSLAQPSRDAFGAGLSMLAGLDELNRGLIADGIEPLAIGIGLHLGDAVVGHVGSKSRHEYTVIGDTVNVAARLEALTKTLGFPLLCSGEVATHLGADAGLEPLGEQSIKGHSTIAVHGWRPSSRTNTGSTPCA